MNKRLSGQAAANFLFGAYCVLMLWLLFGQRLDFVLSGKADREQLAYTLNLVPFQTIRLYLQMLSKTENQDLLRHAFFNLAGNIVMFVPLGFLLPCIWSRLRGIFRMLLWVIPAIAAVELTQYVTLLGSCDIDDLLLNVIGAVWGYGLWKLTLWWRSKGVRR